MLKITSRTSEDGELWELEGKLSGDWALELKRCWKEGRHRADLPLQLHLKAVSYIDTTGKLVLTEMHGEGVEIRGGGCMTKGVVEEIVRGAVGN
jgi:hypothetical protein